MTKQRERKRPARKNIDKGKVKELWLAGCSQVDIAKEFDVSPAAICYHIKNMNSEV